MFLKQRTFNKRGNKSCILFWKYSNILRWTAMWASDCRSQPLNQYSLLFIVICVCSLFFIYSIFFVGVFYVIYFDNSNIVYCIYNLKKLYLTLINTDCHCLEFLSVIPSLFSSSWWLHLCQSGLVLSLLRNMFTLTRYHIIIIIKMKYHKRWGQHRAINCLHCLHCFHCFFTLLTLLPVFTLFTLLFENSFRAKRLLCYTYDMAVWIYGLLSKKVEWSVWSGWMPHRSQLLEHLWYK